MNQMWSIIIMVEENVCFMRYEGKNTSVDASKWKLISGKKNKKTVQKYQMITLDNI